ncbi:hypothetical protein OESDEN_06436 [Oesophagostomum dentatum]|uniref:Nucleotide-diphospho-sugar transferase domain-containing protein n=1 Tax=Oesophagostomum dentatum TaxID=61180 RepID=A0A0B1T8W5_OESDE|nr:hypothetical protein OESDEN_06436 [Oesophagostomum dentatum]
MRFEDIPAPAFVTAMSENHYQEGLTLIANIRKLWPQQKIIVYDIGLLEKSAESMRSKCFVEIRRFPFDNYPPYIRHLQEFRWKPLLMAMVLKEFGALWYMDTSVRWKRDRLSVVYSEISCQKEKARQNFSVGLDVSVTKSYRKKSAFLLHAAVSNSIFATTNPDVYAYIPTDIEAIKDESCLSLQAGFAFIVRTLEAKEILKWYVLCALEKDCMAPPGSQVKCSFGRDRFATYASCHRYDQSIINLLLANAYHYNVANYVSSLGPEGAVIEREASLNLSEKDFMCA